MIHSLTARNFTVLPENTLNFSAGINVIFGENGTGKTHLLKLLYALSAGDAAQAAERLAVVFEVLQTGRLVRVGREKAQVAVQSSTGETVVGWSADSTEAVSHKGVRRSAEKTGCYLSSKGWLFSSAPKLGTVRTSERKKRLLERLEAVLAGHIKRAADGRLCLQTENGTFEAEQLSDGQRQLLRLVELVLVEPKKGRIVFWDLPEAGLNPKFCRAAAECLTALAEEGMQIFLATHSVFLMRELYLLQNVSSAHQKRPIRWISLTGQAQAAEQSDDLWQLDTWTAFDVEAEQTECFLAAEA